MTDNPPPTPSSLSPDPENKKVVPQLLAGAIVLLILIVALNWTASPPEEFLLNQNDLQENKNLNQANANSSVAEEPEPQPPNEKPVTTPFETSVTIGTLADEQTGWLIIKVQTKTDLSSSAQGHFAITNEFNIETNNVQSFLLDLSLLPAQKKKKLVMHIDGQNMAVFSKNQSLLTFGRSPAGSWFLQKKSD